MLCIVGFDCNVIQGSKLASMIMAVLLVVYGPNSDPHVF